MGDLDARDPEMHIDDAAKQAARNCDGLHEDTAAFDWDPELRECPRRLFTPRVQEALTWWRDYEAGHGLPYGGRDLLAEPCRVYDAVTAAVAAAQQARTELASRPAPEPQVGQLPAMTIAPAWRRVG